MEVRSRTVRGAAGGIAAAWIATTVIYVIGNAGSPIEVVTGWAPDGAELSVAEYLITVAVSIAAGALLLWWLERRRPDALRLWSAIAAGVTLVSAVPLWRLDVDTGSKVALSLMHLVTGMTAVVAQSVVRRRVQAG